MKDSNFKKRQIVLREDAIGECILFIRGRKVMLDRDLAALYGIQTFRLNEAVKRNAKRFPNDFMFRLTRKEKEEVIANCDNLKVLKFNPQLPFVFTEQGIAMLSSVLNSERAIQVNIYIMRVFTRLRNFLTLYKELQEKIDSMKYRYDKQFKLIFSTIRKLLIQEEKPKRMIGFHP